MAQVLKSITKNGNVMLAERAYQHIVRKICNGKLSPDMKISDRKIAKELNISHGPVREAMGKLEENGWITRIPNMGAYVKSFSDEEIKSVYTLREILEVGAVQAIIEKITPEQLKELLTLVEALETSFKDKESKPYEDNDVHFHCVLISFIGDDKLSRMFESIILQSNMAFPVIGFSSMKTFLEMVEDGGFDLKTADTSHRRIYEAIAERKSHEAEKLIRNHIRYSYKFISWVRMLQKNSKK